MGSLPRRAACWLLSLGMLALAGSSAAGFESTPAAGDAAAGLSTSSALHPVTLFELNPACDRFDPHRHGYVFSDGPHAGEPCDVAGRQPVLRRPGFPPASYIGIVHNGMYKGTGFFVGKCHILTNCHAAFLDQDHPSSTQRSLFTFGQDDKTRDSFAEHVDAEPVAWGECKCAIAADGTRDCETVENAAKDWALLKLKGCNGDGYGKSYGYALLDPLEMVDQATHWPVPRYTSLMLRTITEPGVVGFPNEVGAPGLYGYRQGAWLSAPCQVKAGFDNVLFHTCPDVPGDSGAPIGFLDEAGRFHVVALQRGEGYDENDVFRADAWNYENANKAIAVRAFYDAVIPFIRDDQDALKK